MSGNSKHAGRTVISKISSILLAVVDGNGRRLAELAAASQLPISTAHRLATELVDWQVLERDENGEFRIGAAVSTPGPLHAHGADDPAEALRARAAPAMEDVFRITAMPVRVGFLVGAEVAYFEKTAAFRPVSRHLPSARLPVHATALGKVLVAFSPPGVTNSLVVEPFRRYTSRTVAGPEEFRSALRSVRTNRIAVCDRELDRTWTGVAAPVFGSGGTLVAAIEVRVHSLQTDLGTARTALGIAASCLSRDLAQHGIGGPAPICLADRSTLPPAVSLRSEAAATATRAGRRVPSGSRTA